MIKQLAFVFPGQGSQSVGMLADLAMRFPSILESFAEASEGASVALWQISQENPGDQLNKTEFTQPALLAANIALWRLWQAEGGAQPAMFCGHSLGEYAALVAAGALSLKDGAHLVRQRGQFMQAAVPAGVGAMAAVLGAEDAQVVQVCMQVSQAEAVVVPANFNSPGQIVIGGHAVAVERAIEALQALGIRKIVKLPVSVPSHTPLMREAAEQLRTAIESVAWHMPDRTVIHNVDAQAKHSIADIQQALVDQLYLPVQWTQCTQALSGYGVRHAVECGPGKVLAGLVKRIDKSVSTYNLSTPADWQATFEQAFS
ncbi:MAG: ACP S-malonyltransferase [Arenimonas sp.]|nr:ACP S-malonyltransferase [Arenimonas sp.]MBP7982138.1 ACP S-malonyltransferase [Arenimonas sp.]